ncbi:hypothetical protein MKK58_00300 [Methylobacterium sp. J-078]|uniref:hypothetical protein n=1 Tax=Methylobacterium sp. J-078 TaxID=2836657 RepID=UPI001FBAC2E1|nr:hypothetical protein [Methylobacterium sp. J-078]MCJ2043000.1 hypothetical protein [Methylobacterium sp. J-078]
MEENGFFPELYFCHIGIGHPPFNAQEIAWGEVMRLRVFAAAAAMTVLGACQTVQPPATASGRPEVTIPGADPARVKSAILSGMIDKGYRIVKDDPFSLTVEKPVENFAAVLLLSTNAGGPPVARVTYTVAQIDNGTRVVADMALISNAGMAFERRTDVSRGADSPMAQAFLDKIAAETQAKSSPKKVARR